MRKAIPPKIRFQVLNRDNFECKYCGLKAGNGIQLQIDHFGIECGIDMYSYINKIEFEKVKDIYRTGGDICSLILKDSGNEDGYFPYEDELGFIINEVKKDIWKGNCGNNYSNRLNYTLTELLIDNVPFSFLMKFSYFYNEIKNEQN